MPGKKTKDSNIYEPGEERISLWEPKQLLDLIIDAAVRITRASSGSLILVDPETAHLNIEVTRGLPAKVAKSTRLKLGEGITGWVAKTGKSLLVLDVNNDKRYVSVDQKIKSELAVPLTVDDEVIGVINVDSRKRNAFTTADMKTLTTLANQSTKVIQNARQYEILRRKAEELAALYNIGKVVTGTLNLEVVLKQVVQQAAMLMKTRICSLMLLNEEKSELSLKAVYGGSVNYVHKPDLKVEESLVGRVIKTGEPLSVLDVRQEKVYKYLGLARRERLCSLLSVPLEVRREVIGVINVYKSTRHRFTTDDVELLTSLADQSAIAIDNARLYEKVITLEEEIRRAERQGVLGELAVEVAHEIRNPLTVVKMLLHTLHTTDGKDKEVIQGEIDRINRIVTRFLDYARPRKPQMHSINLNQLVDDTLILISHRLQQSSITVKKLFGTLPPFPADPDKLSQVFLNLFLNATDAMPAGGKLTITTRKQKQFNQISIKDSGSGIPQEIRDKMFQPFITTKKSGLGLGLSIVKRLVGECGGTIMVQTVIGAGTIFTIKLPIP